MEVNYKLSLQEFDEFLIENGYDPKEYTKAQKLHMIENGF